MPKTYNGNILVEEVKGRVEKIYLSKDGQYTPIPIEGGKLYAHKITFTNMTVAFGDHYNNLIVVLKTSKAESYTSLTELNEVPESAWLGSFIKSSDSSASRPDDGFIHYFAKANEHTPYKLDFEVIGFSLVSGSVQNSKATVVLTAATITDEVSEI
mgnify:CR=1 FL=1